MGKSETISQRDWCLALGHPGGFTKARPCTVRLGQVLDRNRGGFILTDATLAGGDSGGPFVGLEWHSHWHSFIHRRHADGQSACTYPGVPRSLDSNA